MIDINLVRNDTDRVKKGVQRRGLDPQIVDEFIKLDNKWRELTQEIEKIKAKQNQLTEKIKTSLGEDKDVIINESKILKEEIQSISPSLKEIHNKKEEAYTKIPNIPFDEVPDGRDESENVVLREVGSKPEFNFEPRDYLSIGEDMDAIDISRAAKVSGSRFGYLKNEAALLELSLVRFCFKELVKEGFVPVIPPVMIKPEPFKGMGRLTQSDENERYYLEKDDMYLVGSAEHSVGPMHMNEVFLQADLPKRYIAFSSCFRREAGSYGKDTKGILRVHQFDKVEMFSFTAPEKSTKEHLFLLSMQEKLMTKLQLPYRVVEICTGDMGWTDARQFDIETWIPSEDTYRETHSCSNTTDFQARGINVRYKNNNTNSTELVHMLNATGMAIGRMIIAIIENYQNKDGNFDWPRILKKL